MIDMASRAPNGVKVPEKRVTRESILARFQKNITDLRRRLTVHLNVYSYFIYQV